MSAPRPRPRPRARSLLGEVRTRLEGLRARSPVADHAVRAVDRYVDVEGNLLAAGVTYYGFLALFPLVAVSYGALALLARWVPALHDDIDRTLDDVLPGSVGIDDVSNTALTVGVVGLGLLLYAGVRWLALLRRALLLTRGEQPRDTVWWRAWSTAIVVLVLLGAALLASLLVSVLVGAAGSLLADLLHVQSTALIRIAGVAVALLSSWLIYLALLGVLSGRGLRRPELWRGALVGAVGFEVLKQALSAVVAAASRNVVYGAFATTVGLLVWIAYASRWTLLVAAWTSTSGPGPAGPAVPPDQEADGEQAERDRPDADPSPALGGGGGAGGGDRGRGGRDGAGGG